MLKFLLGLLFFAGRALGEQSLCEIGVTCVGDLSVDPMNIEYQAQLVTDEICSDLDEVDPCGAEKCRTHLPELWGQAAMHMWPLVFHTPEAIAFWCNAELSRATATSMRDTCDDCVTGLEAMREVLLSQDAIDFFVYELQGPDFCGQEDCVAARAIKKMMTKSHPLLGNREDEWNAEICGQVIAYVVPRALQVLAEAGVGHEEAVCNYCIPSAVPLCLTSTGPDYIGM